MPPRGRQRCAHCGGVNFTCDDAGFFVCNDCGTVIEGVRQTERDTEDLLFEYTGSQTGEGGHVSFRRAASRSAQANQSLKVASREYVNDWESLDPQRGRPDGPTEADYLLAVQKIIRHCVRRLCDQFQMGEAGRLWETETKGAWLLLLRSFEASKERVRSVFADSRTRSMKVHPSRIDGLLTGDLNTDSALFAVSDPSGPMNPVTAEALKATLDRMSRNKAAYVRRLLDNSTALPPPASSSEAPEVKEEELPNTDSGTDTPSKPSADNKDQLSPWQHVSLNQHGYRKRVLPKFMGMSDRFVSKPNKKRRIYMSPWMSWDGRVQIARNDLVITHERVFVHMSLRGLSPGPYQAAFLKHHAGSVNRKYSLELQAAVHAIYDHDLLESVLRMELELLSEARDPTAVLADPAGPPLNIALLQASVHKNLVALISDSVLKTDFQGVVHQLTELFQTSSTYLRRLFATRGHLADKGVEMTEEEKHILSRISSNATTQRNIFLRTAQEHHQSMGGKPPPPVDIGERSSSLEGLTQAYGTAAEKLPCPASNVAARTPVMPSMWLNITVDGTQSSRIHQRTTEILRVVQLLNTGELRGTLSILSEIYVDTRVLFPIILVASRQAGLGVTGADLLRWAVTQRSEMLNYLGAQSALLPPWLVQSAFRQYPIGRWGSTKLLAAYSAELHHLLPRLPQNAVTVDAAAEELEEILGLSARTPLRLLRNRWIVRLLHNSYLPPNLQVPAAKLLELTASDKPVKPFHAAAAILTAARLYWESFRTNSELCSKEVVGAVPAWRMDDGVWRDIASALVKDDTFHPSSSDLETHLSFIPPVNENDNQRLLAYRTFLNVRAESKYSAACNLFDQSKGTEAQASGKETSFPQAKFEEPIYTGAEFRPYSPLHYPWYTQFQRVSQFGPITALPVLPYTLAVHARRMANLIGSDPRTILQEVVRMESILAS